MKYLIIIAVLLSGCTGASVKEVKYDMQLPDGLKGCKFFEVATTRGYQQLVRCPLSSTVFESLNVSIKTTTTVEAGYQK